MNVAPVGTGGAETPSPTGGGTPGAGASAPDPVDLVPQAEVEPLGRGEWPVYGKDLANTRNAGSAADSASKVACAACATTSSDASMIVHTQ